MTLQWDEIKYEEPTNTTPALNSDYHFHIDGSYEKNSGIGSWGCVMVNGEFVVESSGRVPLANLGNTWNVGAELYCVEMVINYCKAHDIRRITIHYDYDGVEKWATSKWKTNNSITKDYATRVKDCGITITWVHDDSSYRKRTHVLANMAR